MAEKSPAGPSPKRWLRRRPSLLLALPAVIVFGVFFGYPIFTILERSFTDFTPPEATGLDNFRWFFDTPANLTILRRTFATALWVTAICLALAYPYAYLMTLVRPRWRVVMLGIVLVPFWTSLMVRNYAWIVLLQDNGPVNDLLRALGVGTVSLIGNTAGVTIGMAQILLPFMVLPLYATLRGIDRNLLRAAQGLGARPSVAFARVYLPLSLPGILAGALLVFVLALGFYITPALLGSPQNSLLSQVIVNQVTTLLAWGRAGAAAVVLLVLTLLIVWIASRMAGRSRAYVDPDAASSGQ